MLTPLFFLQILLVLAVAPVANSFSLSMTSTSTSTTSPPPNPIALNVKCTIKPTHQTSWLQNIQHDQRCTRRDEPNNTQFIVGQDVDDENTFYLHEEYANADAFVEHCGSDHFARYDEFVRREDPFVCEPELCFYHPRDEDEDGSSEKKRPVHKGAFGLNVNLYPKASVRDEFLKVISANKKGTDSIEELALQYTYGESVSMKALDVEGGENTWHFHEQYTGSDHGKEGFDAHASQPHFLAWEEFVGTDPFEKDPEVYFFRIIEP